LNTTVIKTGKARIYLIHYTSVENNIVGEIKDVAHRVLGEETDEYVIHIHLYPDEEQLFSQLYLKALKHGVSVLAKNMLAYHEAWTGIPCVHLPIRELLKLDKLTRLGVIEHEVAHAKLHGNIYYYLAPPSTFSDLNLLYAVYCSVKDYEVGEYLKSRNIVKTQLSFIKYILATLEPEDYYSAVKLCGLLLPYREKVSRTRISIIENILQQNILVLEKKYIEASQKDFYEKVIELYSFFEKLKKLNKYL